MQNHGSDAYRVCKKYDSVSTRLKLHKADDHGRYSGIAKSMTRSQHVSNFTRLMTTEGTLVLQKV